ncbi:sigma-54-dependent Fis family transcriptional re gulator [Desulfonema ishimotonii]|uniref:Sigma-54-dependent Fis family transcriptional re gulator n=1 Tax=Desulfonema ishimotonii TaxID=45657 RepID=A0A401G3G6_9BACT|nr:sigma-54 dependent transcriptional regulator [Desulfonema ishimotonii]GBC63743.1 sigma-54-dependent Fis family transcriptional re gulator [Desulfonema ishimotonii]
MCKILIIEQSLKCRASFEEALVPPYDLTFWPAGKNVTPHLQKKDYGIILLNFEQDDGVNFRRLKQIRQVSPYTPVVILSEVDKAEPAARAMRKGAADFLVTPFLNEKIRLAVQRALENRQMKNEIDYHRSKQDIVYDFDKIIARSNSMKQIIADLKKFSRTDSTILITGETGTGKSFLSGAVHFNSHRRDNPFIKINCANIPDNLLESELFGHEKGAFTGADKTRVGRLEQGRDGTVFLDEIGEINLSLQAKLLRVLEEKSFERVGGNRTIHSDVRIIAATNRDLEVQVAEGKFREDLFYRINILRILLPALRDRKACIEPLAQHLLEKTCRNLRKTIRGFSPDNVLDRFRAYSWPGNIRQLANTIERAAILEESPFIREENIILPEPVAEIPKTDSMSSVQTENFYSQEKEMIVKALEESLWVQKDAACLLGISPRALNYKIKKLGITHARWRKNR